MLFASLNLNDDVWRHNCIESCYASHKFTKFTMLCVCRRCYELVQRLGYEQLINKFLLSGTQFSKCHYFCLLSIKLFLNRNKIWTFLHEAEFFSPFFFFFFLLTFTILVSCYSLNKSLSYFYVVYDHYIV